MFVGRFELNLVHGLEQCIPNRFARGPLLASKNNHEFWHPRSRKYGVSGW